MLLPLGTDRPLRRPTRVNHVLLGVNISIHLALFVLKSMDPNLFVRVFEPLVLRPEGELWEYVSYAFLHGGWMHLLGNMIVLWAFGPNVEDRFGRVGYLLFYLAAAVVAGAVHIWWDGAPVVGASGAVAGVTGAYLVLFPSTRIRTLFMLFIIGFYMIPAWFFIGLAVAKDLLSQGFGGDTGVAHMAHLAGYAFGGGLSMFLLGTRLLKRETYDLFSMLERKKRQQEIRSAAYGVERQREKKLGRQESKAEAPAARIARLVTEASFDEAFDAFHQFSQDDQLPSATLKRLGEASVERERWDIAAGAFERLGRTYPHDPEATASLTMAGLIAWRDLGDSPRAVAALNSAIEYGNGSDDAQAAEQLLADIETEL